MSTPAKHTMQHPPGYLRTVAVLTAILTTGASAHNDSLRPSDFMTAAAEAPARERSMQTPSSGAIVTVRPSASTSTRQGLRNFVGISGANAGARGLSMNLVVIPAGGSARPHRHRGYETAIYILKGRVRTRYGEGLCESVVHEAGDFVFIPADVPHQPVNLSATEEARAVVARTDPNEQESVELYDVAEGLRECEP